MSSPSVVPAIVIATRSKDAPAGAMASLILEVPDLEQAIESAKASGGTLLARTIEVRRRAQLRVCQGSRRQSDRAGDAATIMGNESNPACFSS